MPSTAFKFVCVFVSKISICYTIIGVNVNKCQLENHLSGANLEAKKCPTEYFPFAFDYWKIMIIFPNSWTLRNPLPNNYSKTFCKHNYFFSNITTMKWIHGIQCWKHLNPEQTNKRVGYTFVPQCLPNHSQPMVRCQKKLKVDQSIDQYRNCFKKSWGKTFRINTSVVHPVVFPNLLHAEPYYRSPEKESV